MKLGWKEGDDNSCEMPTSEITRAANCIPNNALMLM